MSIYFSQPGEDVPIDLNADKAEADTQLSALFTDHSPDFTNSEISLRMECGHITNDSESKGSVLAKSVLVLSTCVSNTFQTGLHIFLNSECGLNTRIKASCP